MKTKLLTALLLLAVFNARAQHQPDSADKPSVHGMLIFGKEKLYASHLPMFHSPHNYQVILELQLTTKDKQLFLNDQRQHPETVTYTIEPEVFVLPSKMKAKEGFKASLYRGHFERGGEKIATGIKVTIAEVLYFEKLKPAAAAAGNEYIFFGNKKEKFLAHRITSAPSFDQVIQVYSDMHWMVAINDEKGFSRLLTIPGNNTQPLGVSGNTITTTIGEKPFNLVLQRQLYLEFDDLKQ
jgi:hypothetical protein